jgi:hypothetical protein
MPRSIYRDVPSLAPTVLCVRGEDLASLAARTAAARHASESANDQRSTPSANEVGS